MYFELHVTMVGDPAQVRRVVSLLSDSCGRGWTFSAIDGDPVLGAGVKCYATAHLSATKFDVQSAVNIVTLAGSWLSAKGCEVVREKVELVLHDTRREA